MRPRLVFPLSGFLLALVLSAAAQQPATLVPVTPLKDLRPGSAAIFKNGLAFVVRHGAAQLQEGKGQIDGIPAASLGSLWVATTSPGAVLEEVVAFRHWEPISISATSLAALLRANTGKTVTVSRDTRQFTGEIMALDESAASPKDATGADEEKKTPGPGFLLLRSGEKVTALNINEITGIEFASKPNLTAQVADQRKSFRFRVRNAAGKLPLTVGYLENGLGWTPSYLVEMKDKNTAGITMQATVINDAEDLEHADLFFVVGYPNFKYSAIDSPMTLRQSLAQLMRSLADAGAERRFDSGIASQALANYAGPAAGEAAEGHELAPSVEDLAGDSEQDLFLYSRPDATLKKGERGLYNVFSTSVSYDEIYEWEVHDASRVDAWGNYQASALRPSTRIQNAAWHALKLKNTSNFPWTTAPAMVVHGTKPISQEMLSYTPKGATGLLKLTIASDIHVDKEEVEIERIRTAVRSGGSNYDAITVEGTLRIHNYKKIDAPMHIVRNIVGEVLSSTNEGKTRKTATAIQALNPNSVIEWEITMKAGEQISIKYRYKILVRS